MHKYICLPTQRCNFVIVRLEVEPIIDNNNLVNLRIRTRSVPENVVGLGRIPHFVRPDKAFDNLGDAKLYAESQFQTVKEKRITALDNQIAYRQKLKDQMLVHNPKVRIVNAK